MVISSRTLSRTAQNPFIKQLAEGIEEIWQSHLELSPYPIPDDLGYVEGQLEGDRLVIENRCYQTPQFRKLHLELAKVSDRLHILHCVMFPRRTYNLPIFGADLVGHSHGISAAIADLSPVKREHHLGQDPKSILPSEYHQALSQLTIPPFQKVRAIPAWGDIFSEFCLFISPQTPEEEAAFLNHVHDILTLHCRLAQAASPLTSPQDRSEVRAGHRYYCYQQRQNDKTRRILESSFGKPWAERYMSTILFDDAA
jgi:phycocyanobilin:ferredoxin oxidoreductase